MGNEKKDNKVRGMAMRYFCEYDEDTLLRYGWSSNLRCFKDATEEDNISSFYTQMSAGKYKELLSYITHISLKDNNPLVDDLAFDLDTIGYVYRVRDEMFSDSEFDDILQLDKSCFIEIVKNLNSDNDFSFSFYEEKKDGKLISMGIASSIENYKKIDQESEVKEISSKQFYKAIFDLNHFTLTKECGKRFCDNFQKRYYQLIEDGIFQGYGVNKIQDFKINEEHPNVTVLEVSKDEYDELSCDDELNMEDDFEFYDVIF